MTSRWVVSYDCREVHALVPSSYLGPRINFAVY
jgi:hypothetical protein